MKMNTLRKLALLVLGSLALALGVVGMVLPVLPTTPFLLLAAFCYMRSSRRLYDWLLQHRLFGPTIRNYLKYRAIRSRTRTVAMILLWTSLLVSIVVVDRLPVRLVLLLIGLAVSWHLAALKTLAPTDHDHANDRSDGPDDPGAPDGEGASRQQGR